MLEEILDFMKAEGIRTTVSIGTLLDRLEDAEEGEFLEEVQGAVDDFSLLDSQRISSLILSLADEKVDEGDNEEQEETE